MLASGSSSRTEAFPEVKLDGDNHDPPLFLSGDEEHASPAPDIGYLEANVTSAPAIERETAFSIPEAQSNRQDPIPIETLTQ